MLLSKFMKEPRFPPSSNVVGKRRSFGTSIYRKPYGQKAMNMTSNSESQYNSTG